MDLAPHLRPHGREEIIWRAHPSWKGMIGWYIRWTGAAVVLSIVAWWLTAHSLAVYWALLITLLTVGGSLGFGLLIRRVTTYEITTKNILDTRGIVSTRTEKTTIPQITNVVVSRSIFERLVGIGRVNFDTAGERFSQTDLFNWWGVENPYAVEEMVNMYRFDNVPGE